MNPGIERGLTATAQHYVNSMLHLGLPWGDAEALLVTLDAVAASHPELIAPSYLQQITELRALLKERTNVVRTALAETPRAVPGTDGGAPVSAHPTVIQAPEQIPVDVLEAAIQRYAADPEFHAAVEVALSWTVGPDVCPRTVAIVAAHYALQLKEDGLIG